ncbi:MAG: apolipoprotein N-acyltransferase [Acidimicrobiia bacterium]|nr:apolipoprotein N-acyltransferase [Acidimicrobiia bacterium]
MSAPSTRDEPDTPEADQPAAGAASGPTSAGDDATAAAAIGTNVLHFVRRPMVRALAAGSLLAGSVPPWGWWPLAFVGLALLDGLIADAPWRSRLGRGAVVGLALFAPTTIWITQLTLPGYVAQVIGFAALTGAFCAIVPPGHGRRPALVGAWVLGEALRMVWPFGGAPLSLLAVGQVGGPLASIARVGGVGAIALTTVAIGVAAAAALRRRAWPVAMAAVGVAALLGAAAIAPRGHDTGRELDIAFVQGGGEQGTTAIDSDSRVVFERHLEASAEVPAGMDLVLWPENVVDTEFDVQDAREGRELQALARRLDASLLVGTIEGVSDTRFRNSQQVLDPDGNWGDRFVKVKRVPFGEWVPFRSFIEKVAPDTLARRDATVSHQSGLLRTEAGPLATMISWEVFFGQRARVATRAGGQLLYNPTNGSTYTGTFVQTQQLASSRLRAIETGRWEVQVSPTGFSAFISPAGRVHQRTGTSERAVEVRRGVPLRSGETWYVRWGDLPARAAAVALLVVGWGLDRRRRQDDDGRSEALLRPWGRRPRPTR